MIWKILIAVYFFFIPVYYQHICGSWERRGNPLGEKDKSAFVVMSIMWPIMFPIDLGICAYEGWIAHHRIGEKH